MKEFIEKYENELVNSVIPFWEKNCIDKEYGGYFTFLDRDGSVYDTDKFMWMQWRIVYMFAEFYLSEYSKDHYLKIAEDGFDFLYNKGKDETGRYYFALNREGEPIVAPYNIYSDCFAAMGAAALFKCTGKQLYKDAAESAMDSYRSRIDNPKGRWEKGLPGKTRRHSLGHYMMLANLGLLMEEFLGSDKYKTDITNAVEMVLNNFWNEDFNVLFENINEDFSFDLDSCDGRHVNPGHGLESMWFFMRLAEKSGNKKVIEKSAMITKALLKFGWDNEHGGIFYFMDVLDKPQLELQWDMKLWWVHNEALIACLYAYKLTGDQEFMDWFKKLDEWTWQRFPDPEYGEWFAYLNRQGEPTHMLKGGKWKTFFHLPRALMMCTELLKSL